MYLKKRKFMVSCLSHFLVASMMLSVVECSSTINPSRVTEEMIRALSVVSLIIDEFRLCDHAYRHRLRPYLYPIDKQKKSRGNSKKMPPWRGGAKIQLQMRVCTSLVTAINKQQRSASGDFLFRISHLILS